MLLVYSHLLHATFILLLLLLNLVNNFVVQTLLSVPHVKTVKPEPILSRFEAPTSCHTSFCGYNCATVGCVVTHVAFKFTRPLARTQPPNAQVKRCSP